MAQNYLILRNTSNPNEPLDVNKGSVLSWQEVDNNFVHLKDRDIVSTSLSGTTLVLTKQDGSTLTTNLSSFLDDTNIFITGTTMSGSTLILHRNDNVDIVTNLFAPVSTSQYFINAAGVNDYTGTTSGTTLMSIEQGVVYIINFASGNTNTTGQTVTIDIDNLGPVPIMKFDDTGPIDLEAGDITAGFNYYATFDGTQLQLSIDEPIFTTFTYTNMVPSTVAVGGIPVGSTFNNVPYSQILDQMLHPALVGQLHSFGVTNKPTALEIGQVWSGTTIYRWQSSNSFLVSGSTKIYQGLSNIATGLTTTYPGWNFYTGGTPTLVYNSPATVAFYVSAQRTTGGNAATLFYVTWRHRLYYGTSSATTLTEGDIESLGTIANINGVTGTYTYASGGYKYFCFPSMYASPSLFRDLATNLAVAMADASDGYTQNSGGPYNYQLVSTTNAHGVPVNYKVFRTKNMLGGTIKIVVT